MTSQKFKSIFCLILASTFFNIYSANNLEEQTELTHEQKVAQIAAPLFAKIGNHKNWLYESLFKTPDNSLRPIADVADIIERFFKLYPTLLKQEENNNDDLKTKKAKREITSYTIARTISGLANVPASERDALPEQARSIITDQSSITRIASAMDKLAIIKNPQQRLQLIEALKSSTFTDEQRLNFAGALYEIARDVDYVEVIKLLPIATQALGFDTSQDCIYQVIRGLALNATPEKLDALVTIANQFADKHKKKFAANFNNSDLILTFGTLGSIPADLRNDFINISENAVKKLTGSCIYDQLNILNNLSAYNTIEQAQAFLERIAPTMEKNPTLILGAFRGFYVNANPNETEQIIKLINRLDALPNTAADSPENTLTAFDLFISTSTLRDHSAEERETLVTAIENVSREENLNKIQRNKLLAMIGKVGSSKAETAKALQSLKKFSWTGNQNPSFQEKLNFVSSFFSGFSYLPFIDRNSKIFEEMLDSAAKYLTPELVKKHSNFFNNFSLRKFDSEDAPAILIDAVFKSSVYDNLDGVLQTATSQLRRLNDANIEIADAEKANLILAVAKINPADREAKINAANQAAKAAGDSYFAQFMEQLTASQQ